MAALLLRSILGWAFFALLWQMPITWAQDASSAKWTAVDSHPAAPLNLIGWRCVQVLAMPSDGQSLAACRRNGNTTAAELHLLQLDAVTDKPPHVREVAHLADASAVEMRAYAPPQPCVATGGQCIVAVVLVDQRDEGSCYGTQVFVASDGMPLRSLGFIDEVRSESGSEICVAPVARVTTSAKGVTITLPGALLRMSRRDGSSQPVNAVALEYHIVAAKPALQRKVIAP